PGQVRELQTLCDLIGERHRNSPSSPSGQQELFPGSGVFISSFHIACVSFMHFLIISSLLRSVKMQSPLVVLATIPEEKKEAGP
ncbi:hypothetical protein XENOCAPTIV_016601, partial [Xenoophorus captivus]